MVDIVAAASNQMKCIGEVDDMGVACCGVCPCQINARFVPASQLLLPTATSVANRIILTRKHEAQKASTTYISSTDIIYLDEPLLLTIGNAPPIATTLRNILPSASMLFK